VAGEAFNPDDFDRPADIDNRWLPLEPGTQWIYTREHQEVAMQSGKKFGLALASALTLVAVAWGAEAGVGLARSTASKVTARAIPADPVVDLNKVKDPNAPSPMLYTQDFQLQKCTFGPTGNNRFFDLLKPGFRHESYMASEDFHKTYRVLKKTKRMNLKGIGRFRAAIIEEREYEKGVLRQISTNWYAICKQTNSVFSVGEFSQQLNADQTVHDTEGSWEAGVVNDRGEVAVPSMQIPGTVVLGARYIFDGAPGVAFGGAEVVAQGLRTVQGKLTTVPTKYYKGETVSIPFTQTAGHEYRGCIQVEEISQISETRQPDLGDVTNKVWCPGIGLLYDTSDGALTKSNRKQMGG
jgi:hypothetical protein